MFERYWDQTQHIFNSFIDSLQDPQRLHAAIVHGPIVLTLLVFIGVVMLIFTLGRSHRLRWGTAVMALLTAVLAWYATETGESAEHRYEDAGKTLSAAAHEALEQHEFFGNYLWIGLVATAVILMISAAESKWLRALTVTLALLTSLGTVGWLTATAHYGGALVYLHGVGVPATENNLTQQPTIETDDDKPDQPDADDEPQPDPDADQPTPPEGDATPGTDAPADADGEAKKDGEGGTFFGIPTDE